MSEGGLHVHGAHEHELEHRAHSGNPMAQQIAIFTAVLATIGAVVSFLGGHTQNEALYLKNEAVLKRSEASDQWNFYQAKSQKESLAKLAAGLATDPAKIEFYNKEAARYGKEKEEIMAEAKRFEKEYKDANEQSEHALHPHHKLAVSMTFLQIAIALASVTALTNKRWLLYGAGASALIGCGLGVLAWFV